MYSTTISAADADIDRKVRLGRLSRPVQYIMQTHLLKKTHLISWVQGFPLKFNPVLLNVL